MNGAIAVKNPLEQVVDIQSNILAKLASGDTYTAADLADAIGEETGGLFEIALGGLVAQDAVIFDGDEVCQS